MIEVNDKVFLKPENKKLFLKYKKYKRKSKKEKRIIKTIKCSKYFNVFAIAYKNQNGEECVDKYCQHNNCERYCRIRSYPNNIDIIIPIAFITKDNLTEEEKHEDIKNSFICPECSRQKERKFNRISISNDGMTITCTNNGHNFIQNKITNTIYFHKGDGKIKFKWNKNLEISINNGTFELHSQVDTIDEVLDIYEIYYMCS